MNEYIQPNEPTNHRFEVGQKVEFKYNGSQDQSGQRVIGQIVGFVPEIKWEGGIVPFDQSGYATDLKVIE
jgi:hypothetical protein